MSFKKDWGKFVSVQPMLASDFFKLKDLEKFIKKEETPMTKNQLLDNLGYQYERLLVVDNMCRLIHNKIVEKCSDSNPFFDIKWDEILAIGSPESKEYVEAFKEAVSFALTDVKNSIKNVIDSPEFDEKSFKGILGQDQLNSFSPYVPAPKVTQFTKKCYYCNEMFLTTIKEEFICQECGCKE